MLTLLENADLWLMRKLNLEWTHGALDRLLPTVTDFAAWGPVIALIVGLAVLFGSARLRLLCLAIGLGIALGDSIISKSLKNLTGRLRPHESVSGLVARSLPERKPKLLAVFQAPVTKASKPAKAGVRGKSFPSSHTMNVCCVATACWLVFGRRTWWVALIAALVSWSRIYCGVHWPSDILFSIPMGILCGWLAVWGTDSLWRRFGGRFFPEAFRAMPALRN